jgi:hypothetical protein
MHAYMPTSIIIRMRNARVFSGVLLVFSWDSINVIFLIQKLHLCHVRRTPEDTLAFLNKNIAVDIHNILHDPKT